MTEEELLAVDTSETEYLLGLLGGGHLAFRDARTPGVDPLLEDMTQKALEVHFCSQFFERELKQLCFRS